MPDNDEAGAEHTTVELRRLPEGPSVVESPTTVLAVAGPAPVDHPTAVLNLPSLPPSELAVPASEPSPMPSAQPPVAPPPGWYSDPWRPGLRYFDGHRWTDHAASSPSGQPSAPLVGQHLRLGVPGWAFGLWWVLVMLAITAVFFFVLLAAGFACDSGWEGCAQASSDAVATYVVVAVLLATAPPLLAVMIARGRWLGRFLRVMALIVMTLSPVIAVVAAATLLGSRAPG